MEISSSALYILRPVGMHQKVALRIADCVHQQLQNKPDAPIFVLGDFNHCKMDYALPGFQQYVFLMVHRKIKY